MTPETSPALSLAFFAVVLGLGLLRWWGGWSGYNRRFDALLGGEE